MKLLRLIVIAIISCLLVFSQLVFDSTTRSAIAAPAPFFNPILGNISSSLPSGMVMRLPNYFINLPAFRPQIFTGSSTDYFAIVFVSANCPRDFTGVCDGGRIFASKRGSNAEEWLRENTSEGRRITLANGIDGFYRGTSGASGARQTLMWEQDEMIYGIISRTLSESTTIRVATSMATGDLFSPVISSGGANCPNAINAIEARLRGDQNAGVDTLITSISQRTNYRSYPPNRPFGVIFRMGGGRGDDVTASPRMMQEVSQDIMNNCRNLGYVGFSSNRQSAAYGIIDNQMTRFRCINGGDGTRSMRINWGEHIGNCNRNQ